MSIEARVADRSPLVSFTTDSYTDVGTVEGGETLKAWRGGSDELAQVIAVAPSEGARREPADPVAHLAADLPLATWTVALIQAHRSFRHSHDEEAAKTAFLAIVDKGSIGLEAAMAGTPHAGASGAGRR